MRNVALAVLTLLVLGLFGVNASLRRSQARLEDQVTALEKKCRQRPAPASPAPPPQAAVVPAPSPRMEAPIESAPAEPRPKLPVPAPPVLEPGEIVAPPEVEVSGTGGEDARSLVTALTYLRRVQEDDPADGILERDDLSDAQRSLLESLRRSRDAELEPFRVKTREIEERYSKVMGEVLTPEQRSRPQRTVRFRDRVIWNELYSLRMSRPSPVP